MSKWRITYTKPEAPGERFWLGSYETQVAARHALDVRTRITRERGESAVRVSADELIEGESSYLVEKDGKSR